MTFYISTFEPMENQFEKYFKILLLSCVGVLSVFVLINVFLDIFGLNGFRNKEKVRVYGEERFSKYLMTFHHIPQNFEGIILGPSLSANLDPAYISADNYFNASLMGARMDNILALTTSILDNNGTIKKAIICIHPYVTSDSGAGELDFMNPDNYWKAYGSVNLLQIYGIGLIRYFDLWPNKYPKNQYKTNGTNQFEELFRVEDVAGRIAKEVNTVTISDFDIGDKQRVAFQKLVAILQANGIESFIYFHPVPYPIYQVHYEKLDGFWEDIFKGIDVQQGGPLDFYNFNKTSFSDFSNDLTNYIDHGHLSKKGQQRMMEEIIDQWEQKE